MTVESGGPAPVLSLETVDALTRLPNREGLIARLDDEIARSERYRRPLSLLLADVDGFAVFEGGHGSVAADTLLQRLSLLLLSAARDADVVARVGPGEFALLLPDADAADARAAAERLCAEVAAADLGLISSKEQDAAVAPFVVAASSPSPIRMRVGLTTLGPGRPGESAALLDQVVAALHRARAERNPVCAFGEEGVDLSGAVLPSVSPDTAP